MPPKRPPTLEFSSLRELYLHFERLFLNGNPVSHELVSVCGHTIKVFDHHFFHLVKLDDPAKPKPLLMANEKDTILITTSGFGAYTYDRQRAVYLQSAASCVANPDEVWEDSSLRTAKWIYIKQFDASPYSFTILLVGQRDESLVLVTSFLVRDRGAKKWRRGFQIYP